MLEVQVHKRTNFSVLGKILKQIHDVAKHASGYFDLIFLLLISLKKFYLGFFIQGHPWPALAMNNVWHFTGIVIDPGKCTGAY